jgi:hypothetical protein
MKTTVTGDQVLPAKLASKRGFSGKEAARPSVPRFDDVLSGLKEAGSGMAAPKAMPHRPAEPLAKLSIAPTRDLQRFGSDRDARAKNEGDGESPLVASIAAAAPQETIALAMESPPAIGLHILAAAKEVAPQAPDRATDDVPGGDKRILVEVGARKDARSAEPTVPVHRSSAPATVVGTHPVLEVGSQSDGPLARPASAIETSIPARPRVAAAAGFDVSTQQGELPPPPPIGDARRSPVAGTTRLAPQTEPAPFAYDEGLPGDLGAGLSVVRQEKHLPPAAAPRDVRVAPVAIMDAPSAPADRTDAEHSEPRPVEARRASDAPRIEPQVKPVTPAISLLQQVANAVLLDIGKPEPQPVDGLPGRLPPSAMHPAGGREPIRMLEVALDPAELGRVTVRMRLTGRTLELNVTAERAETASLLERDRHLIGKILEAGGYSADEIRVQTQGPAQVAVAPALRSAEAQGDNQAAQHFPSSEGSEGEKQAPPRSRDGDGHAPRERHGDDADSDPRRGGALYV